MRLFNKYRVGDKVMINHQGKTRVGTIERDKGYVGGKKIVIPMKNKIYAGPTRLSYRYYKKEYYKKNKMKKTELYEKIMRAIMLIEDGAPHMAKRLLEELAQKVTFIK